MFPWPAGVVNSINCRKKQDGFLLMAHVNAVLWDFWLCFFLLVGCFFKCFLPPVSVFFDGVIYFLVSKGMNDQIQSQPDHLHCLLQSTYAY